MMDKVNAVVSEVGRSGAYLSKYAAALAMFGSVVALIRIVFKRVQPGTLVPKSMLYKILFFSTLCSGVLFFIFRWALQHPMALYVLGWIFSIGAVTSTFMASGLGVKALNINLFNQSSQLGQNLLSQGTQMLNQVVSGFSSSM